MPFFTEIKRKSGFDEGIKIFLKKQQKREKQRLLSLLFSGCFG